MTFEKWQPIKTAPRDADILVFARGDIFIAKLVSAKTLPASPEYTGFAEYYEELDEYFCPAGWYRKVDCEYCEILYAGIDFEPCGWLPLPQLPKIELSDAYQCDDCDKKHLTASEALECCGMPHYTPSQSSMTNQRRLL